MSVIANILNAIKEEDIGPEEVVEIGASAGMLIERVTRVVMAKGMTDKEWDAAVSKEMARLDAFLKASNAAEDAALRGG